MKKETVIIKKNPIFQRCPSCKEPNVLHRSRIRNMREGFIKTFTFYKLYRCKKCGWRGYLSTLTLTVRSLKTLALYFAIALIAAFIVREVLKRFI